MGSINVRKVIVAGLVAGIVLLVTDVATGATLFSTPMEEALAARNLDLAALEGAVPVFLVTDLMYGLLTAFVYAAIRPRFGAGPKSGLLAGFVVWAPSALNHVNFSAMGILYRTGANADQQFNQLLVAPYIGDGSPRRQTMWIDDLRILRDGDGGPAPEPTAEATRTPTATPTWEPTIEPTLAATRSRTPSPRGTIHLPSAQRGGVGG